MEDTEDVDLMMTMSSPQESKKRTIEEELQPVLMRIASKDPSCGHDIIYIKKDQFKIGRMLSNDEVILNVLISRNHCVLRNDKINDIWLVTNLSSTDTLLNEIPIERNETEIIKEGDILQLSLSDSFRYRFTFVKKDVESLKFPRLETRDCKLNTVLHKQRSFVECQKNQRKDLEKQLSATQEEQEQLKEELEKLLQDQKITKTCNEELNNEIAKLQTKIELGNSIELQLQQKYRDLLKELEDERIKYEKKLTDEKQRWQEVIQEAKREKEMLELSMVEQMQEWKDELEKKKQKEWQEKLENLLQEEKNNQTKLQEEKQLLEKKLTEMEKSLEEKKEISKEKADIKNYMAEEKNDVQEVSEHEIIDLTDNTDNSSLDNGQNEAVLNKVNDIMDEQLTCSICSELFIRAITLNCTHTFCQYCINSWNKRRKDCPNCRAAIETMTRSLVVDNFIEKMLESLTPEQMQKRKQLIEQRTKLTRVTTRRKKNAKKR